MIQETVLRDIPVLLSFAKTANPAPLVILSHGFTRSKEDWRGHMPDLTARGWHALALDNRGHGGRPGPDFVSCAQKDGLWSILDIRRMIRETAEDIRTLVDCVSSMPQVDGARIGLAGVSMGAFAGLKALSMGSRIRTMVSIIGSPYWDDVFPGSKEEVDPASRRILAEFAAGHQPAAASDRFTMPVLFQLGGRDPHLRSDRVAEFCRSWTAAHPDRPDALRVRLYPELGHDFVPAMWDAALAWLEKRL
jgi:dienelactone hydrolase